MPKVILPSTLNPQQTATVTWRDVTIHTGNDLPSDDSTWIVRSATSMLNGIGMLEPIQDSIELRMGEAPAPFIWPRRDIYLTHVLTLSDNARNELKRVMAPLPSTQPQQLFLTDWDFTGTRFLWAHPRRMDLSISRQMSHYRGYAYDLAWRCLDPRIYSADEQLYNLNLDTGDETVSTYVTHEGSFNAPWRAELPGPISAPRLWRSDQAATNWFWPDLTIASGHTLFIDSRKRTALVKLNDGSGAAIADVWGRAQNTNGRPSIEWGVPPGQGINIITNVPGAKFWVRDTWI